jgi:DNA repair exonuclease SbcCD ATPase subunit
MKLTRLHVSGFRGFSKSQEFILDANAVVIIGNNGQGKTSIFDAVLWGITGQIPRLGEKPQVVSLYSETKEARVEIELTNGAKKARLIRSANGKDGEFSLHFDDQVTRDKIGEGQLQQLLWPEAAFAPDSVASLNMALTRSIYLQQDLVRTFIEGDDAQKRFSAFAELAGAGRVNELMVNLERQKKSWNQTVNEDNRQLENERQLLATEEAQLQSLSSVDSDQEETVDQQWKEWWMRASRFEGLAEGELPVAASSEAATHIDVAIKALDAMRRQLDRRVTGFEGLAEEIESHAEADSKAPAVDLDQLSKEVTDAKIQVSELRKEIEVAEQRSADERRRLTELRERDKELRALAELASRHLEGPCPVCGQEHDETATKVHLDALIAKTGEEPAAAAITSESLDKLVEQLQQTEKKLAGAKTNRDAEIARKRESESWQKSRGDQLAHLGIEGKDDAEILENLKQGTAECRNTREQIDSLQADGERLSLQLSRIGEQSRRKETEERIVSRRSELAKKGENLGKRENASELANEILNALRETSFDVVASQLKRVEPLLQRIYATADPHPSLTDIQFSPASQRGRGRLHMPLIDSLRSIETEQPEAVMSSSQLNALAVSVFLALNLGVPSIPLDAAMLDDPLQSLDDVNLLGLIDLLRRTKDRRQLFVSTHDKRFGRLLARKLRPVSEKDRTLVIELEAWGRAGPLVRQREIPKDAEVLRIAA